MFLGFRMIIAPLAVIADVVPAIGSLIGAGASLIAGLLAFIVSFVTIGIAWLVYRPLIGAILLVLAVLAFVFVVKKAKKTPVQEVPPVPPTPPPVP